MEEQKKEYDLIKVTYNIENNMITGYVYQKNAYLMLQALHFVMTTIEQEYERDFDSLLSDLKQLNNAIKRKVEKENARKNKKK